MLYVRLPVSWFIFCMPLKTCCIPFSVMICWMDSGEGRCGGNALSLNSVCIANGLILMPMLYKDTVIKNYKFLFSGTRVK